MTIYLHKSLGLGALRCGIAVGFILLASRTVAADSPASNAEASGNALEEIVITAERREERLDKVPISVTAFSQRTMDDLHIQTFADLATIVPGLYVTTAEAGNQENSDVAIRGIFSGGNAPTTQFYIDETPVAIRTLPSAGPSGSPHPLIFDLDRVEVLRGPQGTLFGSSAMGGAIRYITPQPSLHDTSGIAKAEVSFTDGGDPNYETGVAYGAPVVDGKAGFRVSGWFQQLGGFIDKEDPFTGEITKRNANSSNAYVIRPAFTVAPTDDLKITPAFFMQHSHQLNPNTYWLNFLPNPEAGSHVSGAIQEPYTDDLKVASLAVKYDIGGLNFVSDTSYLDRKTSAVDDFTHAIEYILSGNVFVPGLAHSYSDYLADASFTRAWLQEFRLSSEDPASRINWVAGLYYRRAVQGVLQYLPGSINPLTEAINGQTSTQFLGNPDYVQNGQVYNALTDFQATDISEAAFGEITLNITPQLKANLGLRYEHAVVEHQTQITAGPLNGVTYVNVVGADQIGNPVTPRFGLTYQFTEADMVYASAAKGYRAGGGNGAGVVGNPLCDPSLSALGLTIAPASFNSDSLWSYEVGSKDTFFNHKLAIQASVFFIDWKDIQTVVNLPSCAQGFTANRGKAISRGFDLQIAGIIADGLKAGANVGYTDAYYPNAAFGAPNNGVTPILNEAGDKLANVVPWTASANLEYSRQIDALWHDTRTYFRVDYRWLDGANRLNSQIAGYDLLIGPYQNPAYSILNVRVGVLHGGFDISAFVNNATKSDPKLKYYHDASGDPLIYSSAIQPLSAGFTAFYRF